MSISSEDSFASCTSFPYSDDIMKSDGSRSVTPSVASERLSRDDLDQYFTQRESSRSANSLLEPAMQEASGMAQESAFVSYVELSTQLLCRKTSDFCFFLIIATVLNGSFHRFVSRSK